MRGLRFLIGIVLIVAARPALAAASPAAVRSDQSRSHRVQAAVEAYLRGKATGTVLVASHGRVIWAGGIGDPIQSIRQPARSDAGDILSIGKTITAVAVQRLANSGRIRLDASVRRYIPELPSSLEPVTIQSILDNASGWGAYLNDKGDFDEETEAQLIADLARAERPRAVGTYGYSNTGFQALGLVVQRVTAKPFKAAIHELVFGPSRMSQSDFLGSSRWRGRVVMAGFKEGRSTGSPLTWPSTWSLLGAAGIASTVDDLYRFNRTYLAGSGLGSAGRDRMLADGATTKGASPYKASGRTMITYGSGLYHWRDASGRRVHVHGGDGDYGTHSLMFWREDDDLFIAGLFNSGSPSGPFDRGAFIQAVEGALGSRR